MHLSLSLSARGGLSLRLLPAPRPARPPLWSPLLSPGQNCRRGPGSVRSVAVAGLSTEIQGKTMYIELHASNFTKTSRIFIQLNS